MANSQNIQILGSNTKYWIYNADKTPTIVMIHGLRGTHHGLEDIIKKLPNFKIIIPDLPGFGESTPMTQQAHDIIGYSVFVQEFIKKITPNRPILLGHSFGSIVVSRVAALAPDLISKLILVNAIATPALKGPRKIFTRITVAYYWLGKILPNKIGTALLSSKAITLGTSVLMAKTKDKKLRKYIHKSHLAHFSQFKNRQVLSEAFNASINHTATDFAADITAQTLLIAGEIDDIAPAKGQYTLEKTLPNARLIIIPKVGHLIHHETPQQAAKAITDFCKNSIC
ncbi:MAG: alpha/beta hydrolase [Candidatus Woesebacteria bacterium]|jgi:pimeloyl-ACP methyl ester carboxylesterase